MGPAPLCLAQLGLELTGVRHEFAGLVAFSEQGKERGHVRAERASRGLERVLLCQHEQHDQGGTRASASAPPALLALQILRRDWRWLVLVPLAIFITVGALAAW